MDIAQAVTLDARRREQARQPVWEAAIVVGSVANGRVDVNASGVVESAVCPASVTVLRGDTVAIVRAGSPLVLAVLRIGDPDNPAPIPSAPASRAESGVTRFPALFGFTWEFNADETKQRFGSVEGMFQGTSWSSPLNQRRAFWFHQTGPTSQLKGATVDSARIYLKRRAGSGNATAKVAFADRFGWWPIPLGGDGGYGFVPVWPRETGNLDSPVSAAFDPAQSRWVDVPASVAQYMIDGHVAGDSFHTQLTVAIGVTGDDDMSFTDLDADPTSGLLEITWHRS